MNINQKREIVLENLWDNYDFEDRVVAGFNGWERHSPDNYSRIFFLENKDGPSLRATFNVKFERGTIEVEDFGWE